MQTGSTTERLAVVESEIRRAESDRVEMWRVINEIRIFPSRMDAQDAALARIEALCQDKEARVRALELCNKENTTKQNMAFGFAGAIAALVGGVAVFCVERVMWPIIQKVFNLD